MSFVINTRKSEYTILTAIFTSSSAPVLPADPKVKEGEGDTRSKTTNYSSGRRTEGIVHNGTKAARRNPKGEAYPRGAPAIRINR